jgi:hypothetical protein
MTIKRFKIQNLTGSTLLVMLVVIVLATAFNLLPVFEKNQSKVAAIVDGEPVTNTELRHWMLLNKADVYNQFYRSHNATYGDGFWTKQFDGKTPLEILKRQSLDNAIRYKLQQKVAKELGIYTIMNFDELMRERERVNENRKNKVENGQSVYGPVNLTPRNYVEKVVDEMVQNIKYVLSETDFKIPDKKMKQLYSEYKIERDKHTGNGKDETHIFEGFKAVRQMQYTEKSYDQLIEELSTNAEIEIITPVYEKLKL